MSKSKPTLAEAVRNVMKAYPGSTFFKPGPHNIPEIQEQIVAGDKRKPRQKRG